MSMTFGEPFDVLFGLQRALEARRASDWLRDATTSMGPYPPINVFQRGNDFVAIIELPGVSKSDLEIQAKENTIRIAGKKSISYDEGATRAAATDRPEPDGFTSSPRSGSPQ